MHRRKKEETLDATAKYTTYSSKRSSQSRDTARFSPPRRRPALLFTRAHTRRSLHEEQFIKMRSSREPFPIVETMAANQTLELFNARAPQTLCFSSLALARGSFLPAGGSALLSPASRLSDF